MADEKTIGLLIQLGDRVIDLEPVSGIKGSLILPADTNWQKVAEWLLEGRRSYQEYLWLQERPAEEE